MRKSDSFGDLSVISESDTTTTGNPKNAPEELPEVTPVVTKANLVVNQAELLAFVTLLYTAAALGIAVHLLSEEKEEETFETAFYTYSKELTNLVDVQLQIVLAALLTLGDAILSHAQLNDEVLPFTRLPGFENLSKQALLRTSASAVSFSPIVREDQADAWALYSGLTLGANETVQGLYMPSWQYAPPTSTPFVTQGNLLGDDFYGKVAEYGEALLSPIFIPHEGSPSALLVVPLFEEVDGVSEMVGMLDATIAWEDLLAQNLPEEVAKVFVEVEDTCKSLHSFEVTGPEAAYAGNTELHDYLFRNIKHESLTWQTSTDVLTLAEGGVCVQTMKIFGNEEFRAGYDTNEPRLYTTIVLSVFLFTALIFVFYFVLVRRRQSKLESHVEKTTKIVTSIFPGAVGKRILEEAQHKFSGSFAPRGQLKQLMHKDNSYHGKPNIMMEGKPLADLFTDTTIMFGDIVGFTAWSSTREPTQVFTLLETIYHSFDQLAHRRRVFKVETVGDCYVAVSGLPDPRKDHAVVMARFAYDCLQKFSALTKQMEVALGPDTGDLGLRIGLHSGPVTAGVLRGERARFQLFGDTVNTTARMETTGVGNRIHLSQQTAELLTAAGKSHWCVSRADAVFAKGKGELKTFWLAVRGGHSSGSDQSSEYASTSGGDVEAVEKSSNSFMKPSPILVQAVLDKHTRLIDWNTDLLLLQLKDIVAEREASKLARAIPSNIRRLELDQMGRSGTVLDEVEEIIRLPRTVANKGTFNNSDTKINDNVRGQLRDYIQTLSVLYRKNAFHNFEHASHVTMSVHKLFTRIVAPDITPSSKKDSKAVLHDHTYGISSDPLTRFAVYLSALIHDTDHTGVPNSQLVKEGSPLAKAYGDKSVAEQNSVDLAWNLLMKDDYNALRRTIYTTKAEFERFRRMVVNTVMATDIMDKNLSALRKGRWKKAFDEHYEESSSDTVDRKATIVIEHLIQASDVAHTMQHWHVYRKWNARLFTEMYQAFLDGRSETDPSESWYQGEIGFFDFYIIPLAKNLKDCGVFGVSSDEYLNYAEQNRMEWERKGQEVVAELVESVKCMTAETSASPATAVAAPIVKADRGSKKLSSSPPGSVQSGHDQTASTTASLSPSRGSVSIGSPVETIHVGAKKKKSSAASSAGSFRFL